MKPPDCHGIGVTPTRSRPSQGKQVTKEKRPCGETTPDAEQSKLNVSATRHDMNET